MVMKPEHLKAGQCFRVADACNPAETVDSWTVVTAQARTTDLPEFVNLDGSKGRSVVTRVDVDAVRSSDGKRVPLVIYPWVELTLVERSSAVDVAADSV